MAPCQFVCSYWPTYQLSNSIFKLVSHVLLEDSQPHCSSLKTALYAQMWLHPSYLSNHIPSCGALLWWRPLMLPVSYAQSFEFHVVPVWKPWHNTPLISKPANPSPHQQSQILWPGSLTGIIFTISYLTATPIHASDHSCVMIWSSTPLHLPPYQHTHDWLTKCFLPSFRYFTSILPLTHTHSFTVDCITDFAQNFTDIHLVNSLFIKTRWNEPICTSYIHMWV